MKRSRAVQLILLASATAGCARRQQCVDEQDIVVEDRYCQQPYIATGHGYRWYSGGFFNSSTPVGSSVRSSGTVRGVFGSAGEGAHGGGGE